MKNIYLIIGFILALIGLIKIDIFLIPTLDYFGKFVFFGLFNIISLYLVYSFRKYKFVPIIIGSLILMLGVWVG